MTEHCDQGPKGSKLKRRKQTISVDKLSLTLTSYLNLSKTKSLKPWRQLCEAGLGVQRCFELHVNDKQHANMLQV